MKITISLLILFFSLNTIAQTDITSGNYELNVNAENGKLKYSLNLNSDGTFLFHFFRHLDCKTCTEENQYGKGNWKVENKLIYFFTDKNLDIDEHFVLDLNNSKARFDTKSPRNKSAKEFKTKLRFYESDIFWIKGVELIKL